MSALTPTTSPSSLDCSARSCATSDFSTRTSPCTRLICSPKKRRSIGSSAMATLYHKSSQIQHQACRILQAFFHPHQERHRLAAIDDAVIVGEREIHHWADLELAADRH